MKLPLEKRKPVRVNPRKLILFGLPKCGKTTIVSELDDCLILELEEGGADFVEAMTVSISSLKELYETGAAIKEANYPYQYIAIDTITKLEEMILPYAASLYKKTPMGKHWTGSDVKALPNGAGYLYLRMAFRDVLDTIASWAPNIIQIGHLKDKLIEKNGEEFSAKELDLIGKNKTITSADADAIGYVYRQDNKTKVNFKSSEEIICGSRSPHLKGQDIIIAESDKDGKLTTFWDRIYTNN